MCIFVYPNNCELLTHDWCLIHLSLSFVLAQCREIPAECIKANASSLVSHRYSHDGTEASSTTVIFCPHIPVVSWSWLGGLRFQDNKPNTNARQARMLDYVSKRAKTSRILWKADFKHIHLRAGLRILWVWQFIINSPLSVWKLNYIQNTKTTWCKAYCLWEEKAALQGRECESSLADEGFRESFQDNTQRNQQPEIRSLESQAAKAFLSFPKLIVKVPRCGNEGCGGVWENYSHKKSERTDELPTPALVTKLWL